MIHDHDHHHEGGWSSLVFIRNGCLASWGGGGGDDEIISVRSVHNCLRSIRGLHSCYKQRNSLEVPCKFYLSDVSTTVAPEVIPREYTVILRTVHSPQLSKTYPHLSVFINICRRSVRNCPRWEVTYRLACPDTRILWILIIKSNEGSGSIYLTRCMLLCK